MARAFLFASARQLHLDQSARRPALVVLPGAGGAGGDTLLALRELPEHDASALWLREVEGLDEDELAVAIDRAPGRELLARSPELGPELRALPLASEVAPPAVLATLRGLAAGAAHAGVALRPRQGMLLVLALALVSAAVAIGITRAPPVEGLPPQLAHEIVSQHLRGLALDGGCEERGGSSRDLSARLSRSMHSEVRVPAPADGSTVVCGRRSFLYAQPAAAVVYRRGAASVTLFLPGPGSAAAAEADGSIGTCAAAPEGQTVCVVRLATGLGILVGELPGPALWSVVDG